MQFVWIYYLAYVRIFWIDYPWSGSLRPVSNKLMNKGRGGREDPEAGGSPWAGSLRHVDKNKMSKKKKKANDGMTVFQAVMTDVSSD